MICRHKPGDKNCTSGKANMPSRSDSYGYTPPSPSYTSSWESTARSKGWSPIPATPDSSNYTIEKMQRIGSKHVVLQVKYPNCKECAFEGLKTLAYLNVTEMEMLNWKTIDPHFGDPNIFRIPTEAPSPIARFPGTDDGFIDATMYLEAKALREDYEPETFTLT